MSFNEKYYSANSQVPADAFRATRTLVQFLLARPLLREGDDENVVFILEKRS